MKKDEIKDSVINLLITFSGKEQISASDELQLDLGLDSLGLVTLLMTLEDEFGIVLNESDMNPFDLITVTDVIELTERYYE